MSTSGSSELCVAGRKMQVTGRILRTARLQSELYVRLEDASTVIQELKQSSVRVDIGTFLEDINDPTPKQSFYYEAEKFAVLPITTYDEWFKSQLTFRPRNKLRKALKSGIEVRVEEFSHSLLHGIKAIYDESPVRQGRRNRHYNKDFETIEKEHSTLLERSQFIAVYCSGEMIGFAKVTFSQECGLFMNFLSKIGHRDKAPNNAILAKAIELCAARKAQCLVYGGWGRGGAEGLDEFKVANGFQCVEVPRYYVPLTFVGMLALRAGIHRGVVDRMPRQCVTAAANMRGWWNARRFRGDAV